MLFCFKVTVDLEGTILCKKKFFLSSQISDYYCYLHSSPASLSPHQNIGSQKLEKYARCTQKVHSLLYYQKNQPLSTLLAFNDSSSYPTKLLTN